MNKHCDANGFFGRTFRGAVIRTRLTAFVSIFSMVVLWCVSASAVTLNVVDGNGTPISSGFRWLLEEDTSTVTVPGAKVADSITMVIHKSYSPVSATGHVDTASASITLPGSGPYVLSVLPDADYAIGGALVTNGQSSVTVVVNAQPLPTAQISVLVFADHNSINNVFDSGEQGLAGFSITLADLGGQMMQDAFGNMLGTTYQLDENGNFVLDGEGNLVPMTMGDGRILTDVNGEALIKYLPPGKYGVQAIPPAGQNWHQTATIEGTPVIDAFVKANEPVTFVEGFGTGFKHVSFGFINPDQLPWAQSAPGGSGSISGKLVYNHFAKPPRTQGFHSGEPVGEGWVGLNDPTAVNQGLYAVACDQETGEFTIQNVPPGTYELVTWDTPLLSLFGFNTVTVPEGGSVDLGDVLCFRWFGTQEGNVFYDSNTNGFRDVGEVGIPRQNLNLRFRDGTVYQSTITDSDGNYSFPEVFPFFKWLVSEVDYGRFKPTGMTAAVDQGGEVPVADGWTVPSFGKLNPQPQFETDPLTGLVLTNALGEYIPVINPNTSNNLSRTETGPVLLEANMLFLNQVNVIDWGKVNYDANENGGIAGIVYYDTTRAEDDPQLCVGEPWEPGIPRVQVNLYADSNYDKIIDDLNSDGQVTLSDVDNYPFGWADGGAMGPEDLDRNTNTVFDAGDAIQIVHTDSWDDSMPEGSIQTNPPVVHGQTVKPGFDGFGTWNQVRPGVFDGGYWFNTYFPGGMVNNTNEVEGLPNGHYIVEAVPPAGYELVKAQDKNVDFGDSYEPSPLLLLPETVGNEYVVPAELSLFPGVEAALAGETLHLPDRKVVELIEKANVNCDFFFFTPVPKAARAVGFANNDLSAEFDPTSPIYGEKASPSWIPVSFQDWQGHEVARVYCDEFGGYNTMLPSSFSVDIPTPSGVAPNMLTLVLNHPTMPDPNNPGQRIPDPYYDPDYAQTPWTFQYYPGTVTYLDTPLVPLAAFVGYPSRQMDVEPEDGTPVIFSAEGPYGGPWVYSTNDVLTITSMGDTDVPNPNADSTNGLPVLVSRDFGFGSSAGAVTVNGIPLSIVSWTPASIQVTAPAKTPSGQLKITRGDNNKSMRIGLTLTVGDSAPGAVHHVSPAAYPATPIQDAIDVADPGDLILVAPGEYNENIIMWKPVRLQGAGAQSTIINANPTPIERLSNWHAMVLELLGTDPFQANEAPGIVVFGNAGFSFNELYQPRIDGFRITGSLSGGGINVYTDADYLRISNNRISGNQGSYGGAISVGDAEAAVAASNNRLMIRYNEITVIP